MPQIEIVISPKGTTRVRTVGFSGSGCRQASAFLEKTLGQTTHESLTPEFFQVSQQQEQQRQRE